MVTLTVRCSSTAASPGNYNTDKFGSKKCQSKAVISIFQDVLKRQGLSYKNLARPIIYLCLSTVTFQLFKQRNAYNDYYAYVFK